MIPDCAEVFKENLRICNKQQNAVNTGLRKDNKSGFKGVFKYSKNRWKARFDGKHLGSFSSPEEAAMLYDKKLVEKFGEFARTNSQIGGDYN